MGATTGLAQAAYQGFMDPYLKRQNEQAEEQKRMEEGKRIRDALMGVLPQAFPGTAQGLVDSLLNADPRTMSTIAPIVTGQAQYAQQRTDAANDRKAEWDRDATKETADRDRENEGFFQIVDLLATPEQARQIRSNPNVKYNPSAQAIILRRFDDVKSLEKLNADIKAIKPQAPTFQTAEAAMEWWNNEESKARDERSLDRQMTVIGQRQGEKPEEAPASNEDMTPFVEEVRVAHQSAKTLEELRQLTADPDYQAAMAQIEEWDRKYWMQLQREYLTIKNKLRSAGTR